MLSQLCNKSTSSHILTKQVTLGPEEKLLETSDREQIVSYTRALRWRNLFSPDQKKLSLQAALGLHSPFCRMQSELKTSSKKTPKNNERSYKREQAWRDRWTLKRGPKPLQKHRGAANLQSTKISISRACEACETKLGCVLSFLENAIITQVILAFWLVLAYDLLEDRCTIEVTISFYANKV